MGAEKDKLLNSLFYEKTKILSVLGNVNRASSLASTFYTEENDKCQAFNQELLAFPKLQELETSVSHLKRMKNGEMAWITHTQNTKQSVTFSTSPSLNEVLITQHYLTQIEDKHCIWIKSSSIHTSTHSHKDIDSPLFFFLVAEPESMAKSVPQQQKIIRLLPWKICERSEVESKSICSCTCPSVPQIHPFQLHYHLHWSIPLTGLCIILHNWALKN